MIKDYKEIKPCDMLGNWIDGYAEKLAKELDFNLGDDIEKKIIVSLGGVIEEVSLDEWTSRDSLIVRGANDFKIVIESNTILERKRFLIAHELGHYFLHSKQGEIPMCVHRLGWNPIVEAEASHFGLCLLMPRTKILEAYERSRNSVKLAIESCVYTSSVRKRMKMLNIDLERKNYIKV